MRSPWWYRLRALTIGFVYFVGFFLGPIVSGLVGLPVLSTFVVLGRAFGERSAHAALIVAVVLATICWALRLWGGAYLRPAVVWNPDALNDRLIVEGPFRFVRNPLYLGNLVLALAMGVYASPLGAALLLIGNAIVASALISVEEPLLRERYGSAFDAYTAAVPALFPRVTPWQGVPSAEVTPSFADGFRSELLTAAFIVATIVAAAYFWHV